LIYTTTQVFARILAGFLLLLLVSLALLGTPAGSAWLLNLGLDLTRGAATASGVSGTFLSGLGVERLAVRAGRTTLTIDGAELGLAWPDLLGRQVRLAMAKAARVRVQVAPPPPDEPDTPVAPLLLPFPLVLEPLAIGELEVEIEGNAPVVIANLRFAGVLRDGILEFTGLDAELYGLAASGQGTFDTGEPFALKADVRWTLREPAITGRGKLSGSLAALRFEQVLMVPEPVAVGGLAKLLADDPVIFAEARWEKLSREVQGAGLLVSQGGRLKARGWINGYQAELLSAVRLGTWPRIDAQVEGAGDREHFAVERLALKGLGGQVTGQGRLQFSPDLKVAFELTGRNLNPQPLDRRLAGTVNFSSRIAFAADGGFSVDLKDANGTLFRRPFRASGQVARRGTDLAFERVTVAAGPNRLDLSGTWGARIAGQFRIDAPELGTLWPDFRGRLRGSGTLGGTAAKPMFRLDLDGAALSAFDVRIEQFRARGGLGARDALDLDLRATGIRYGNQRVGNLDLEARGSLAAHTLRLALAEGDITGRLRGRGSWRQGVLTEEFTEGSIALSDDERWELAGTLPLRVAGASVRAGAHCWARDPAELCLADARYDAAGFEGGLRLRQLPLATFAPLVTYGVEMAGVINGDLTVRRSGARTTGRLSASLDDGAFTYRTEDGEEVTTQLGEARLSVDATDEALDFSAVLAEALGLNLKASARVSEPFGDEPTIVGALTGGIPDLAALGPVIEPFVDIGDLKGSVTVDVGLSGRARQPDIEGGVQLADGALTVPAAGITVDRITLAVLGGPDGTARIEGAARSGKGYVALDGKVAWRDRLVPEAEFTVKGRVFDVIRVPEGYVQVSPDVRVVLDDGRFLVGGELQIPRGQVRLKKIAESAARPSPDTIVHGREELVATTRPPLFVLDGLKVRLGSKVSFEGFGLKTGLTGGLTLSQSVAADPTLVTGQGVVKLEGGEFQAFGQTLAIERGSLIFAGVVTDPGLDVKATREVNYEGRDVTVGVLLTGSLSRIQPRIYSQPAMGEMDALSYLTTGRPLSAASEGDRFSVAGAAVSLGLNTALPVAQQIGSTLKLDEVGIGSGENGDTAVVIGERLGNNLYVRTSYGVFDRLVSVTATYKVGRRFSIEGTSGGRQAVDLIYSVNW
jgi:translocation and assembly module TamB